MSKEKEKKFPAEDQNTDKKVGKNEEKFKQSEPKEKLYKIIWTQNRSRELRIGRENLMFTPYGINPYFPEKYRDGVSEKLINHPDFETQKKYFTIKEV